jgi:hypothetical protein
MSSGERLGLVPWLLTGVVRTNHDFVLGSIMPLLDASATAPATFEAVELQALMFFCLPFAGARWQVLGG